jgi:hypothetical protein
MTTSYEQPTMEQLAADLGKQWESENLAREKRFAEKRSSTAGTPAVAAPADEYQISTFRFDYLALVFYIRIEAYITYASGEKMQFHGQGGGVGAGDGIFAGGNGKFFVPPRALPGDCSFWFQPALIGALIHFWRGDTNIGDLVGAGAGVGFFFGGTGTWTPGP